MVGREAPITAHSPQSEVQLLITYGVMGISCHHIILPNSQPYYVPQFFNGRVKGAHSYRRGGDQNSTKQGDLFIAFTAMLQHIRET